MKIIIILYLIYLTLRRYIIMYIMYIIMYR